MSLGDAPKGTASHAQIIAKGGLGPHEARAVPAARIQLWCAHATKKGMLATETRMIPTGYGEDAANLGLHARKARLGPRSCASFGDVGGS